MGSLLDSGAFDGTILLSHLHWDHTHGLPFFPSGNRDDAGWTMASTMTGSRTEPPLTTVRTARTSWSPSAIRSFNR